MAHKAALATIIQDAVIGSDIDLLPINRRSWLCISVWIKVPAHRKRVALKRA